MVHRCARGGATTATRRRCDCSDGGGAVARRGGVPGLPGLDRGRATRVVVCAVLRADAFGLHPTMGGSVPPAAKVGLGLIQRRVTQAKDSMARAALGSSSFSVGDAAAAWRCPKCRREYGAHEVPTRYTCFCGSVTDPPWEAWGTAHSCNELCGRPERGCGHRCVLKCHLGPCPPCPIVVPDALCHCGRTTAARRCGASTFSCGAACGRLLSCGVHRCEDPCHPGPCSPCPHTSEQPCRCGHATQARPCSAGAWSCSMPCSRMLSCGHHRCDRVCHAGECGPCPLAQPRSCPCGTSPARVLPCTEEVPVCGGTCGRKLPCDHECPERCHRGECPPCNIVGPRKCRCGKSSKELPCSRDFTCAARCGKLRDCGRHSCRRRCCDSADCGRCPEVCGKRLPCGNHKCEAPCHAGPCYPCIETRRVPCACGGTERTVPCGRERTAAPPRCKLPCRRPLPPCGHPPVPHKCHPDHVSCPQCDSACSRPLPACGHPPPPHKCHGDDVPCPRCESACSRPLPRCGHPPPPHLCHADDVPCPPCSDQCDAVLPNCGHRCAAPCHVKSGAPCPPCTVLVPRRCVGRHTTLMVPCSADAPQHCDGKCGHPLACGRHACTKACHSDAGDATCGPCSLPCQAPRPAGCEHACSIGSCHDGPCPPCNELKRLLCHCGSLELNVECETWLSLGPVSQAAPPRSHPRLALIVLNRRRSGTPGCPAEESATKSCPVDTRARGAATRGPVPRKGSARNEWC